MQRAIKIAVLAAGLVAATAGTARAETACNPQTQTRDEFVQCGLREAHQKTATDRSADAASTRAPDGTWRTLPDGRLSAVLEDGETKTVLMLSCDRRNGFEFQLLGDLTRMSWPITTAFVAIDGNPPVELSAHALVGMPGPGPIIVHTAERVERAMLFAKRITIRVKQRDGVDAYMFETKSIASGAGPVLASCPAP